MFRTDVCTSTVVEGAGFDNTFGNVTIVDGAPCAGALVDDGDGTGAPPSAISFQFCVFAFASVVLSENATDSPLISLELNGKLGNPLLLI